MKTLHYFIFLLCALQISLSAQTNLRDTGTISQPVQHTFQSNTLQPIYFNFSRRQLFYDKTVRANPKEFLNLCRSINDPQIKNQIARYDHLTQNKKIISASMIGAGVAGYILTMAASYYPGNSPGASSYQYPMLFGGLACLLATPILAITTSVPHQKRKEVLFRDLPDAYNFYVFTQSKK